MRLHPWALGGLLGVTFGIEGHQAHPSVAVGEAQPLRADEAWLALRPWPDVVAEVPVDLVGSTRVHGHDDHHGALPIGSSCVVAHVIRLSWCIVSPRYPCSYSPRPATNKPHVLTFGLRMCVGQLAMGQHVRVVDDGEPLYEPFAGAFETHASESAYNAHYDRPAMLDLMGDVHGSRVLDVGCGPGLYAEQLIARGAVVTAFDASPEMVRLTRARVGSQVDVRVSDLEAPLSWLPDGSQDLAVMALVLHHIDNRAQALREIHRVLRPGGRLYVSTTHPTSDWMLKGGGYFDREQIAETWQTDWHLRYWKQPLEAWCAEFSAAGFLIERLVEPRPAESMASAYPDEYRHLMDSPGFIAFALVKPGPE
jgi:ubiquinone/menaquinone biosynthesis C-methylase UbiE